LLFGLIWTPIGTCGGALKALLMINGENMKYLSFGKTGLQVSQVALGTGNFGTGWGHGADQDTSKAIFNAYAEAGGNFIDGADIYQFGQSEELIGALLQGRRENFVLATKYTKGAQSDANRLVTGNSRKAMVASVETSLKRLRTDRIDIYWAHWPDNVTPAEESFEGSRISRARARFFTPAFPTSQLGGYRKRSPWPNSPMLCRSPQRSSNTASFGVNLRLICSRPLMRWDLESSPGLHWAAAC
jgi:hypothetical protein